MAVTFGFFDSVNGDRKYNADQMSEYFRGIVNEGVFQHLDGGFAVTAGTGLSVSVATGRAIVQDKWIQNDAALPLTISTASDVYGRIDAVVIRLNNSARSIEIAVKTGTPASSPAAPEMTRTSATYEMALAYVAVAAGGTSVTVTDKRSDATVCGWATVAQETSGEVDAMLNAMKTGFDRVVYPSPAAMVQGCDEVLQGEIDNVRDMYPWDKNANLAAPDISPSFANMMKSGVIDIRIFNARTNKKYYMSYFNRSNDGNNICTVVISEVGGSEVCRFSEWYHLFNGIERIYLNESNNSCISGIIIINWDVIVAGSAVAGNFQRFGLSELAISHDDFVDVFLPADIYWAKGRELSIYFNSIIMCNNLDDYQIDCVGTVGKQQNERYVYENPAVGNYQLTVNVYSSNYGRVIAHAQTNIHVIDTAGSNTNKKVCFLGDSWTENPRYIVECQALFDEETDSDSITLIGTRYPWGEYPNAPKTEGRGGWSAYDYVTKSSVGSVTNAFYKPGVGFDFSYYVTNSGVDMPDIVCVLLGVNDVGQGVLPIRTKQAFDTIISSIKSANNSVKIGLGLTPPPCQSQDGFGKVNGVGQCYWAQKSGAYRLAKELYETYKNDSSVFIIPVMSSVDMFYNVSREEVAPNAYNTDITITRISDNVHCNTFGYNQVADAFYGALKNQF